MIILYFAIIIIFIVWGFKDYKKSFIAYSAVSLLFNAGMAIRYAPPSISVNLVLNLFFVILYFTVEKKKYKSFAVFPLKKAFYWMVFSITISALITWVNGSFSGITSAINNILGIYLFVYIFWNICDGYKDIKYFVLCLIVVFILVYIYGVFEYITRSNPFLDLIKDMIPEEYADDKLYVSDLENLRDGRFRAQSLFFITILYGISSLLFMFFILNIRKYKHLFKIKKTGIYFLVIFSLFACYASNSKTPLVALPFFIMPLVIKNKFLFSLLVIMAFVFLLDPTILLSPLGNIIDLKAFDVNNSDMSEGSNAYMRLLQLEASVEYRMKSPFLGNGLRSGAMFSERDVRLFGCESVWFRTMIESGALGLIAYIKLIIDSLKTSVKFDKTYYIFFYSLAFYLICSITDINYTMYFMCFCIMLKLCMLNKYKYLENNRPWL